MTTPLVSIVMPTQGRAELLGHAITSVLGQSLTAWELIIIDDASTDATRDIVAAHSAADPRIVGQRLEYSTGAATARNRGIAMAHGSYVAFLDDDCVWRPEKLDRQLQVFQASRQIGLVYSPYIMVEPDGSERLIGGRDVSGPHTRRVLLRGNVIGTPAVVVRRDVLEAAGGFDEELQRFQDWDLWLRVAALTEFGFVPEPLLRSVFVPGGISTRSDALDSACRRLNVKYQREVPLNRTDLAEWQCTLGHILVLDGAWRDGRNLIWRGVRSRPWPPRRLAMAGCALLGSRVYHWATRLHAVLRPSAGVTR